MKKDTITQVPDIGEHFDFIEAQRRQLKEQISRALLRAVRIERLLMSIEDAAESALRELKERPLQP